MPDMVGIGAVNLDYVISRADEGGGGLPDGFEFGSERAVSEAEAEEVLRRLASLRPLPGPGGSALNTVASIAAMDTDVTVGYVGICGRSPTPGFSFDHWLSSLAIDRTHLATATGLAGICISYTDAGERSLLTTPGANADIMAYLDQRRDTLVPYLAAAKIILVTSFVDRGGIRPLVRLLEAVVAANPAVLISCDPGAMWSHEPEPDGLDDLLAMTDWFLVNRHEAELHERRGRMVKGTTVVKQPERVELRTAGTVTTHHNPNVLTDADIVDDTGSGDAFAAGLLWALADPDADVAEGISLGMDLARAKLGRPGLSGIDRYADIHRGFLERRGLQQ